MRLPIRAKLILAIGVPLVAVYVAVLVFDYMTGRDAALRDMETQLTELVARRAAELGGALNTSAQIARSIATYLETQPDIAEQEAFDLLRRIVRGNSRIHGAGIAFEPRAFERTRERFAPYVFRREKGLDAVEVGSEFYDYFRRDWYLVPKLLGKPAWTGPYCDEAAGGLYVCTYAVPFRRDGVLRGVAGVDVSLRTLRRDTFATKMGQGYGMIIGRHGTYISHPDESLIMRETIFSRAEWFDRPDRARLGRAMTSGKQGVMRIEGLRTPGPRWAVFAPIPACGWSLAAVISEEAVLGPVHAELRRKLALMSVGLVLLVGIILLTSISITRPISQLAKALRRLAAGELSVQVDHIRTHDEIGELARTFNRMVKDLEAHVEAVQKATSAREAVEGQLRIARSIQASLLPRSFPPFPDRKEFALHAVNVPAQHVAGDFYDFYFVSDHELALTIGDVSGKGVPAALFMAVTRTLLKNLCLHGLGPAEVLQRANDLLVADNTEAMFVTLFLGLYDTRTGHLRYANGGHNPPYCLNDRGRMTASLAATGTVLGAMERLPFEEKGIELAPGDTLALYTDGVTEAHAPGDALYGEERLERLLSQQAGESVDRLCEFIVQDVTAYQGASRYDDITLLILRRNEPGAE